MPLGGYASLAPLARFKKVLARPAVVIGLFVLAGFAALGLDMQIAAAVRYGNANDFLAKLCDLAEVFAHGVGVTVILAIAYVLDPRRRADTVRVGTVALSAGLAANLLKMTVARMRPNYFLDGTSVSDSFAGWLPGVFAGSSAQSFPSGHAATAVAFALGLAWMYPRGARIFAALAVLASVDRVLKGHHFASDVFWGGALGYGVASVVLHMPLLPVVGPFTLRLFRAEEAASVETTSDKRQTVPIRRAA